MFNKEELEQLNAETDKDIKEHLKKFNDIEKLFQDTYKELEEYFSAQSEYKTLIDFKKFLKQQLEFYVKSFSLSFDESMKIAGKITDITEAYDKIIFYWEYNPVKARRDRLKQEEQELHPETKWITWWAKIKLKKILR